MSNKTTFCPVCNAEIKIPPFELGRLINNKLGKKEFFSESKIKAVSENLKKARENRWKGHVKPSKPI